MIYARVLHHLLFSHYGPIQEPVGVLGSGETWRCHTGICSCLHLRGSVRSAGWGANEHAATVS